jgi:hypothetical protein
LFVFVFINILYVASTNFLALGSLVVSLSISFCCNISLTVSSLLLRFSPDHAKDDYRGAAHWLLTHSKPGETIWWAADSMGGTYYKIFSLNPDDSPSIPSLHIMNPDLARLETVAFPKFVALSKLDLYDAQGAIQQWLKTNSFQLVASFQSFTIWASP